MTKKENTKKIKTKYWYRTDVYACVCCGREDKYRERVYEESLKGSFWKDDLCSFCRM